MKILIMSIGGKTNEPEDLKTLHLYLLSLKKNVVPFFNTKVILYNCATESVKTNQLIELYGLTDIVEVRRIDDMQLPQRSYEFMEKVTYWESRIGLIMNMMFDFAYHKNFYNARWVFQTDTDIEFLPNFASTIETLEALSSINNKIVVSQAGDVYEYSIGVSDRLGYFKLPRRLNLYDETDNLEEDWASYKLTEFTDEGMRSVTKNNFVSFSTLQQKVRNDFIGMTIEAAACVKFNWIHANSTIPVIEGKGFIDENWTLENPHANININADKGSLVAYELFAAKYGVTHVQLQGHNVMSNHINAGWCADHYDPRALVSLNENYSEYKEIWSTDFKEVV
jgi:hypothetical protein